MKFEKLRAACWDASFQMKPYSSMLVSFQNTFTTDFPVHDNSSNEAFVQLDKLMAFVHTAMVHYSDAGSLEHRLLLSLLTEIKETRNEYIKQIKQ